MCSLKVSAPRQMTRPMWRLINIYWLHQFQKRNMEKLYQFFEMIYINGCYNLVYRGLF